MLKTCGKCTQDKDISEFNKNSTKKDGLQLYCRECNSKNLKRHYQDNKEYYFDKKEKRKLDARTFINEIKENAKCAKCPEDDIACLDFHHEDRSEKEFSIATALTFGYSLERLQKEIGKCTILCSNCHRKFHYYNK